MLSLTSPGREGCLKTQKSKNHKFDHLNNERFCIKRYYYMYD